MKSDRQSRTRDAIIRAALSILESGGYDGLKLKNVAKRARVSLSTIYKFFPGREELIVKALERWMEEHCYSQLDGPIPRSLPEALLWHYRRLFGPWERSPKILEAYYRARLGPGGSALDEQGIEAVLPFAQKIFEKTDPTYAQDIGIILEYLLCSALERAASGETTIRDVFHVLERAVVRLTSDNKRLARSRRRSRTRALRWPPASMARLVDDED